MKFNCLKRDKSSTMTIEAISGQLDQTLKEKENDEKSFVLGRRHLVAFLAFAGGFLVNFHREVMSVSIVAMVNQTRNDHTSNSSLSCPVQIRFQNKSADEMSGEFEWSSNMQGYILGINFLGNVISQPVAGKLIEIWGTKQTFLLGNSLSAVFTIVSPFSAYYTAYALIVVQLARGLAQGLILPSIYSIMGKWFPSNERTVLSSLVICGYCVGSMAGGMFTGLICDVPYLGWPYAFYLTGIFTILFSVFFAVFYYETPQSHPNISKSELRMFDGPKSSSSGKKIPVPWRDVITSIPIYAVLVGLIGQYWALAYFWSVHPTYIGTILNFPMTENGITSSLPFVCQTVGILLACMISGWLGKKNYVGVDKQRKACNSIGCFGFSTCLLAVYFAGCDVTSNIVLLDFAIFFVGISMSGSPITVVDMSPNFVGSLMGILSSIASIAIFLLPVVAGAMTKHKKIEEWHEVFVVCIVVVFTSGVIFQFFGSAEVQPWNYTEGQEQKTATGDKNTKGKQVPTVKNVFRYTSSVR